jgi:hypothetical protein
MRGVVRAGREAYQHADAVPLRVGREQLAFDPGRDLFPFRLGPPPPRRQYRLFPRLFRDAKRKPPLQRCRWPQHIGGPGDEPIDHRPERLRLVLTIRARGDVCLDRACLARRQDLQDVGARQLGSFAPVQVWALAHWLMADPTPIGFADRLMYGECEVCISVKTSSASFWIGPRWWRAKKESALSRRRRSLPLRVSKYF